MKGTRLTVGLNFGLVGCGRVSGRHADSISEISKAKLVAVCDIVEERAMAYESKYDATPYIDYSKMLQNDSVDVVCICTPSGLHAEMGIKAAQAGKHIIVEKPMALNVEDADKLIKAAESARVKLCIVLQNRYNKPIQDLYQLIQQDFIGKVLLGNATVRWFRPQEYYEDGWHGTWAQDGGALMNQCIHHIDVLQWLFNSDVTEVFAFTATLAHDIETEDVGVAVMRFANGGIGNVEGSTIIFPKNIEGSVSIFGEKGSLKVGGTALNRKVLWKVEGSLDQEATILAEAQQDPPSVYGYSHRLVIEDMIQAVLEDRRPKTDGYEGRKSVELVCAMYESAQLGKPISLLQKDSQHA